MRGIPATFWTNNTQFHNSFLPHIIRDLRERTVTYSANSALAPIVNTM